MNTMQRLSGWGSAALIAYAGLCGSAHADGASAMTKASARVITPVTVVGDHVVPFTFDINSGHAISEVGLQTILLDGDTPVLNGKPERRDLATITVSAEANSWYAITLPKSPHLQVSDGNNAIAVRSSLNTPIPAGFLNGLGHESVTIFAQLSPEESDITGTFFGSFEITLERN